MIEFFGPLFRLGQKLRLGGNLKSANVSIEIDLDKSRFVIFSRKESKPAKLPRLPGRTSSSTTVRILPAIDDVMHMLGLRGKKNVYTPIPELIERHDLLLAEMEALGGKLGKAAASARKFFSGHIEEMRAEVLKKKIYGGRIRCRYKGEYIDEIDGADGFYEKLLAGYMEERTSKDGVCIYTHAKGSFPDTINVSKCSLASANNPAFLTFGQKVSSIPISEGAWSTIHDTLDLLETGGLRLICPNKDSEAPVLALLPDNPEDRGLCETIIDGIDTPRMYSDAEAAERESEAVVQQLMVPYSTKTSKLDLRSTALFHFAKYTRSMSSPFQIHSLQTILGEDLVKNVRRYIRTLQIILPVDQISSDSTGNKIRSKGQIALVRSIPQLAYSFSYELASGDAAYKGETRKVLERRAIADLHNIALFGRPPSAMLSKLVSDAVRHRFRRSACVKRGEVFAHADLLMLFSIIRAYRPVARAPMRASTSEETLFDEWLATTGG